MEIDLNTRGCGLKEQCWRFIAMISPSGHICTDMSPR
jgi:hypothetical protein